MFDQLTDGLPDWVPSTLILKQDSIVWALSMGLTYGSSEKAVNLNKPLLLLQILQYLQTMSIYDYLTDCVK